MKVQVNTKKVLGAYTDPTRWMNSTLRYVPPVDFPEFLEKMLLQQYGQEVLGKIIEGVSLTPYNIWLSTVVISGISYVSYLLKKYVFKDAGIIVTGILGGVYSSTATCIILAKKAREAKDNQSQYVAAIYCAIAMMYVKFMILMGIFNFELLCKYWSIFVVMALFTGAIAMFFYYKLRKGAGKGDKIEEEEDDKNPLEFKVALIFASLFIAFTLITHYTLVYFGTIVPGGKEREDVYCPNCKVLVHSEMTSQCIQAEKVDDKGKRSLTEYEVIKEFNNLSLINVHLLTGRTHQIRLHFSSINHPLVGDYLYGSNIINNNDILLFSYHLDFIHPITNKKIDITLSINNDFNEFIRKNHG